MYKYETINFQLEDNGIGLLTLNRPKSLNAINFQMVEDLHDILDHLMINLNCRVLILTGEGRGFCAGLDLKESNVLSKKRISEEYKKFFYLDVPEVVKQRLYFQWRISNIIVKMRKITQPIIAAINGAAAGGGFTFAMASDIRIASVEAKFLNAFIKIGVSGADLGSSWFLPRLIGLSRAAEILYTGRTFDAEEAERIGLISRIIPNDQLIDTANELAENLIGKSPLGLRMTKEAINLSMDAPSLETIIQLENRTQILCSTSKDAAVGVASFFSKKDPEYPLK